MHSFVAYIDESGDDGLKNFRQPGAAGGSSTFLFICAAVVRQTNVLETVAWRDEIKTGSGKATKGRSIHFPDLNHSQKRFACQCLSSKPVRFISVASHKPSIPSGLYGTKNTLYFYATRYVIERLSWFCRDMRPSVREGDGRVKIIFSRRGGMSYPAFADYLRHLRENEKTSVHWPVIDTEAIEAKDHSRDSGLQLADCGARAIAEAFEPDRFGNVERQYLEALQDRIYSRKGNFLSYGVKFLPDVGSVPWSAEQQRSLQILR